MIIKLIEFFMPGGQACENVTDIELVRLVHKPYIMITQTLGGKVTYRVPKRQKFPRSYVWYENSQLPYFSKYFQN